MTETSQMPAYVIMGATGGIGSELSRTLAAKGAKLLLAGRQKEKVESLAGELGAQAYVFNATRVEEGIQELKKAQKKLLKNRLLK